MKNLHQKRLLALDGGGIMGVITLQLLKRMEDQLRAFSGAGKDFVLADYFDYIGGTSTGAIVATGLALGKPVDELIAFYEECGPAMFKSAGILSRLYYRFTHAPLVAKLQSVIGTQTVLELIESKALKSHLLIVTRNATTDSAWPLSTNPAAKYNDPKRTNCNLKVPLWQLVRASTAAPTYFSPELITFGDHTAQFVDGAISPYNNPALLLYKKATLPEYRMGWAAGEDRLMLVSLGTGFATSPQNDIKSHRTLLGHAQSIPGELLRAISRENDMNCRIIGRCVAGPQIDREVGDLIPRANTSDNRGKAFLYARYDADISEKGLKAAGLSGIDPQTLVMDNVSAIPDLKRIGQAAADQIDLPRHFPGFL